MQVIVTNYASLCFCLPTSQERGEERTVASQVGAELCFRSLKMTWFTSLKSSAHTGEVWSWVWDDTSQSEATVLCWKTVARSCSSDTQKELWVELLTEPVGGPWHHLENLETIVGGQTYWIPRWACCHTDPNPEKRAWLDEWNHSSRNISWWWIVHLQGVPPSFNCNLEKTCL